MRSDPKAATYWRSALDLLQKLGCGGLVVDRSGAIVSRNAVADLLAGDWGLSLPPDARKAVDGLGAAAGSVDWYPRKRDTALILYRIAERHADEGATALLVLIDPGQPAKVDESVVRGLFGLTQAEAKLAIRLCRGERLRAIAHARGVSLGTVRSQLRAIFSKTRTKSQAGLVLLLARLATLRPDD
jgi:DNA-binding CsgD family transcriptional regulator